MLVKLQNMTFYVKQGNYYFVRNPNEEGASGDIYVRINGEYKLLSGLDIYSHSGTTYTKVAYSAFTSNPKDENYYIVLGSFYEIPSIKYLFPRRKHCKIIIAIYVIICQQSLHIIRHKWYPKQSYISS